MLSRRYALALSAILCTGAVAGGSVINVPQDFPNIMEAIDAAVNGDTVVVAPGTYTGWANRDLDFAGKAITVRSTDPDDAEIVAATVIDCGQAGRGFLFQSGETPDSVVDGLTITNGFATEGAGVFLINGSGATIRNCVFIQNTTPEHEGIIQNGNNPAEPAELRILDSTIQDNLGSGFTSYFIETLTISGCTISGNTGAGIRTSSFGTSDGRIEHSTITANGDAGIDMQGDLLEVSNSTVTDNAGTGVSLNGDSVNFGGVSVAIVNTTISRNGSRSLAGGVDLRCGTSALVRNCLVSDNIGGSAGGMFLRGFGVFEITTSTFTGNQATNFGGGAITTSGTEPVSIRNSILWGNTSPEGPQLWLDSGFNDPSEVSVDFSDLEGGAEGVFVDESCCSPSELIFGKNNLDTDPFFVEPVAGDYHLSAGSPLIDSGDPDFVADPDEIDIDGDPRVVGPRVDLGADEFRALGDLDGDGSVSTSDLLALLSAWGPCPARGDCPADLNGDGSVGTADLLTLLANWG